MFAGNKVVIDLVLPATTVRGTGTCEPCNGRGAAEAAAHNTLGRYDRRDGRDRGGRGDGNGVRGRVGENVPAPRATGATEDTATDTPTGAVDRRVDHMCTQLRRARL